MSTKFTFLGLNLPDKITGHHYGVTLLKGVCLIAATAAGAYMINRGDDKRRRKRLERVTGSREEFEKKNPNSKPHDNGE